MADFGSRRIENALAALAASDQPGAAGVASALAGAGAAALLELSAGLTAKRLAGAGDDASAEAQIEVQRSAAEIRQALVSAADEDSAVYEQVMAASDPKARARALDRASEPPLSIAESCADLAAAAAETAARSREWAFNADAIVAARLAAACAESAAALVTENAEQGSGDPRIERARDASGRAAAAAREAAGPAWS